MLRRARPWLGTLVEIRVEAANAACEPIALEAAFAAIAQVHAALSFHEPGSELSLLNREAATRAIPVSSLTAGLLRQTLAMADASNGLFDPTVASELVARGARPHPHSHADAIPHARTTDPSATWRDVTIDADDRVRFRRPLWLDLGGIAKGYAVDRALAAARAHGADAAVVNAGGDLAVFGAHEANVSLRVPGAANAITDVGALRDGAAAGSVTGNDGIATHFDGRNREVLRTPRAVVVFAPQCTLADALTKPVLCDPMAAQPLLARFGASACVFDGDAPPRLLAAAA